MTPPPIFPVLPGQGGSVHKKPNFSTRVAGHVSGREVRGANYLYPLWDYELTFDGLASNAAYPGLGVNSLQSLLGLFLQCQGQFGTFLYRDPTDCLVTGQGLGTGDGTTTNFLLQRSLGGFTEPVGWGLAIAATYVDGVQRVASSYSLIAPNILSFSPAPLSGGIVTADFSFAFLCRFSDDVQDFEEVMSNLWTLQSLKFRSIRPL